MPTREQYEGFFKAADADNSGTLSIEELVQAVKKNNPSQSESDLRRFFKSVDTSGDGQICMQEYLRAMGFIPTDKEDMMRNTFNQFDTSGDGFITKDELKQAMNTIETKFTECELDRMMKIMDKSGDGKVDYSEFIKQIFNA